MWQPIIGGRPTTSSGDATPPTRLRDHARLRRVPPATPCNMPGPVGICSERDRLSPTPPPAIPPTSHISLPVCWRTTACPPRRTGTRSCEFRCEVRSRDHVNSAFFPRRRTSPLRGGMMCGRRRLSCALGDALHRWWPRRHKRSPAHAIVGACVRIVLLPRTWVARGVAIGSSTSSSSLAWVRVDGECADER